MKNINLLLITFFLLHSCGGFKEAGQVLRNEKIRTTDEFLIKKQEPLVLPPDYNEIPKPDSLSKSKIDDKKKIKDILKNEKIESKGKKGSTSSVEQTIIDRIRK